MNHDSAPTPRFPEGFKEFLMDHALPCPPFPTGTIDRLEVVDANFYATDFKPLTQRILFAGDAENLFDERTNAVGYGLAGYGLQNREVVYFVDRPRLRLAISLPWSRVYGDPEEERENLHTALQLAEACQSLAAGGDPSAKTQLTVTITPNDCRWSWTTPSTVREGDNLPSLVLFLEETLGAEQLPDKQNWMPV